MRPKASPTRAVRVCFQRGTIAQKWDALAMNYQNCENYITPWDVRIPRSALYGNSRRRGGFIAHIRRSTHTSCLASSAAAMFSRYYHTAVQQGRHQRTPRAACSGAQHSRSAEDTTARRRINTWYLRNTAIWPTTRKKGVHYIQVSFLKFRTRGTIANRTKSCYYGGP